MTITTTIINGADALPLYVLISSLLEGIIFQDNRGLVFFLVNETDNAEVNFKQWIARLV